MSVAVEAGARRLATGKRAELSVGSLAFRALLLIFVFIALLTLLTLLIDVFRDGSGRLSRDFLTRLDSRLPARAGIRPALYGSLWLMGLVSVISFPIGVGAAVYLEEFSAKGRFSRFIEVNIANLAGVPSVVYGLLGLAVFVRFMHLGRSVLAGAMTLSLLILPVVIVAAREASTIRNG